jgi:hypothetical protein
MENDRRPYRRSHYSPDEDQPLVVQLITAIVQQDWKEVRYLVEVANTPIHRRVIQFTHKVPFSWINYTPFDYLFGGYDGETPEDVIDLFIRKMKLVLLEPDERLQGMYAIGHTYGAARLTSRVKQLLKAGFPPTILFFFDRFHSFDEDTYERIVLLLRYGVNIHEICITEKCHCGNTRTHAEALKYIRKNSKCLQNRKDVDRIERIDVALQLFYLEASSTSPIPLSKDILRYIVSYL